MRLRHLKRFIVVWQAFILLSSFASTYWQVHGLFGERGLLPVASKLNCDDNNVFQCRLPFLHVLSSSLQLSPSVSLQLTAFVGIILSIGVILVKQLRNTISFIILFVLLRTIQDAGDVFFFSQADAFLLESTGYVAVLAWFRDDASDIFAFLAILGLGVRTLLSIGIAKVQNDTWFKLEAFDQYFELIPLPTVLSRDVHLAPNNIKQYLQIFTNFAELVIPVFILLPFKFSRYTIFSVLLVVQLFYTATANSGTFYYNILVVFMASLNCPKLAKGFEYILLVGVATFMKFYISNKLPWTFNGFNESYELLISNRFGSVPGFITDSIRYVNLEAAISIPALGLLILSKIFLGRNKLRKFVHLLFVVITLGLLSAYGTISFLQNDPKTYESILKQKPLMKYHKTFKQYGLAGQYNQVFSNFGSPGRPEIVIEGSTNVDGPWKEIVFYAKPGPVKEEPKFVAPHVPRLDMQMWVAGQGTYQQNPFFLSLVHHLMENTTEVVRLIEDYPFKNKSEPMNFVKATLYMYHYTELEAKDFWTRQVQEEYMPVFNKGNPAIVAFLEKSGNLVKNYKKYENGKFGKFFKKFHRKATQYDQSFFVRSILSGVFFIHVMNRFR